MQWRVSRIISVSESVSVLRRHFRQHTALNVTLLLPHINLWYTVLQLFKKFPAVYENQEAHYIFRKGPPPPRALSPMNAVYDVPSYSFVLHFRITFPPTNMTVY